MKKCKKAISAALAAGILASAITSLSVFASTGKTVLKYTFDSETTKTLAFNNNDHPTIDFSCYDGYDFPFLYTDPAGNSIWSSGWYSYTNDSFNGTPSAQEMYIEGGKLYMALNAGDLARIRIPVSDDAEDTKVYNINFTMKKTGGNGQFLRIGIDGAPAANEDNSITFARKGGDIPNFGTGNRLYDKSVSLEAGRDHELYIRCVAGTVMFSIDEITISEVGVPEVIKTFPADGSAKVSTYINPVVYFDNTVEESTISNIKLLNGSEEISATASLDSTGKKVTLSTSSQLPANSDIKISVPDTVTGKGGTPVTQYESTFRTGELNVLADFDFEKEFEQGDLGLMFGYAGYMATKELAPNAPIDGSQALKVNCNGQWHEVVIYLVREEDKDNMKIEGNNVARMYNIEYDLYVDGSQGTVGTRFEPTWGTWLAQRSYETYGKVIHVKDTVNVTTCWNPAVRIFSADDEPKVIYVDNFKVKEIFPEEGAPRIISSTPENGAEDVRVTSSVEVLFNQALDESSFDDVGLYKFVDDGDPVPVEARKTISSDLIGRTVLNIDPVDILDTDSLYGLDLYSVKSNGGETLDEEEQAILFTTSSLALDKIFARIECDGQDITGGNITSAMAGKKADIKFDGFGLYDEASFTGYAAVYLDGKLIKTDMSPITVSNGEAGEHALSVEIPEDISGKTVEIRAFVWDEMTPVSEVFSAQ